MTPPRRRPGRTSSPPTSRRRGLYDQRHGRRIEHDRRLRDHARPARLAPLAGTDAGPITSATYRTATIGAGDLDVHTISGNAGGSLLVTIGELTAGAGFDPEISVYTPAGSLLGSFAAAATGTVILAQSLPTTGTYYVVAADNFNDETGDYGITVATFGGVQDADGDGGPIVSGVRRTGTIAPGDFDVHTISGTAGGSLLASIGDLDPASGYDPQMLVISPTGVVLANVAAAVGTDTLVQNLAASGAYYVVTLDQFADETGAYALSVAAFGGTQTTDADSGPINSGERRTGTIDIGDFDVYTISATAAGSLFSAIGETATSGYDPEILVFSPSGALLDDAAAAAGTNSLLQTLAATGTYYVVALDQFGDETGSYALSVARFGGSQNVTAGDEGSDRQRRVPHRRDPARGLRRLHDRRFRRQHVRRRPWRHRPRVLRA